MSSAVRSSDVNVALVASLIMPHVQRLTGVPLSLDDVAALVGLTLAAWHAGCTAFEKYFPPPNPTAPVAPATEIK
jgi:hypothetical protein